MRRITLTQGKFALVDNSDYDWINQYKWCAVNEHGYWYALGWVNGKSIFMHRLIINTPEGQMTDHKSGDGLDNRRTNLRVCTVSQNGYNQGIQQRPKSSAYKGVYWYSPRNCWRAIIKVNSKRYYLGNFKTELEAVGAYDLAAFKYHGQFANLNLSVA